MSDSSYPTKMPQKLYRCPECGRTLTDKEYNDRLECGGMGYCGCRFLAYDENGEVWFPREYVEYDVSVLKLCPRCNTTKPISAFGKNKSAKNGIHSWCKECCRKEQTRYRGTPMGIYNQIKSRQKYYHKHGHPAAKPFNIKPKPFVEWYNNEPKICVYCDILEPDFLFLKDKYGSRTDRLTVDCIDNSIGYTAGNMVLACERCNFLKSNLLTYDEMREFAQKYIKPKWMALKNGETSESIYLVHTKR